MTGLEQRIEHDLRQIADRATPSPDAWSSILTRISDHGLDDVPVGDTWSRDRFEVLLDQRPVSFTDEQATIIDLETPVPIGYRQKGPKLVFVAGLAAAAVAAIAIVATRVGHDTTPGDQSPPPVTVPATLPPRVLFARANEQLAPGTYYVDGIGGSPTPRMFVTVGEGWHNANDLGAIRNDGIGVLTFVRPAAVFAEACQNGDGGRPMTDLPGFVTALSQQSGWANVTKPTDITISGFHGKTFQRTAHISFAGCVTVGVTGFQSFADDGRPGAWTYYERGEVETLRVLDVNGTVIMITTRLNPIHDADAAAQLAAVLDSIRIEQT